MLIVDCDPGIDDAISLGIIAGAQKKGMIKDEIFLISTWGNVPLKNTLKNALICCGLFELKSRVVEGEEKSLSGKKVHAKKVHGIDGLGGASKEYENFIKENNPIKLSEFIDEILKKSDEKINIVSTGPLTSVAKLLMHSGIRIKERIEKIVWMGGAFFHDGNITPYAEFNAYCDPDAVKVLFDFAKETKEKTGKFVVEIIPLDATEKTQMKKIELISLIENEKIRKFVDDITAKMKYIILHDPLAVFTFLFPQHVESVITVSRVDTEAIRGKITSIITPTGFLKVVNNFNKNEFKKMIKELLS